MKVVNLKDSESWLYGSMALWLYGSMAPWFHDSM